ncbi:hypothetical protein AA309_25530 [Microvirga vignae]|uniref:Uncharacterized protein n=2 Tax=Microvirga vignae TaxID=1225564 RepID=A0A0H1R5E6_9HYPH|nr:hypothetical protein AA309_25530 [Microvirga vignae]
MLWRSEGAEFVMIPAIYRAFSTTELHLLAFSHDGSLMFDQLVTQVTLGDVTGDSDLHWWCLYIFCYSLNDLFGLTPTVPIPGANELPVEAETPLPSVGVSRDPNPVVVVADNNQHLIGYNFSPTGGFTELFRKHLATGQIRMSSPTLLQSGHSVISANYGDEGWLLSGGPSPQNWTEVVIPRARATPALTNDGRIISVARDGTVRAVSTSPNRTVIGSVGLGAETIAPVAASCTHLFVSTVSSLVTLDARSLAEMARFSWKAGGQSPPAIGPSGMVYAFAENSLFIFPAPRVGRFVLTPLTCRDVLIKSPTAD